MSSLIVRNALVRIALLVIILFGMYKLVQWFVAV
jgi:hypothetical protein